MYFLKLVKEFIKPIVIDITWYCVTERSMNDGAAIFRTIKSQNLIISGVP